MSVPLSQLTPQKRKRLQSAIRNISEGFMVLVEYLDDFEANIKEVPAESDHKKKRKVSKSKDKNAPKRNYHSYVHFAVKMSPLIKAEHPELNQKEVYKEVGVKWNALTEEEKQPYIDLANKDKVRYSHEMEEYIKNHPPKDDSENESDAHDAAPAPKKSSSRKTSKSKKAAKAIKAEPVEPVFPSEPEASHTEPESGAADEPSSSTTPAVARRTSAHEALGKEIVDTILSRFASESSSDSDTDASESNKPAPKKKSAAKKAAADKKKKKPVSKNGSNKDTAPTTETSTETVDLPAGVPRLSNDHSLTTSDSNKETTAASTDDPAQVTSSTKPSSDDKAKGSKTKLVRKLNQVKNVTKDNRIKAQKKKQQKVKKDEANDDEA